MSRTSSSAHPPVTPVRGDVVLTLSGARAKALAQLIQNAGPPAEEWIRDLVRVLLVTSDEDTVRLGLLPGPQPPREGRAAGLAPTIALANDAAPVRRAPFNDAETPAVAASPVHRQGHAADD